MAISISSYTYLVAEQSMMLTYEDGTTETFTKADADKYIQLTGRAEDAKAFDWAYTPVATENPNP